MKHPKTKDMAAFMGLQCVFTGEYYRTYLKKVIGFDGEEHTTIETIPVKWGITTFRACVGFVVGFGVVYNGKIVEYTSLKYKQFKGKKAIKYVRVRKTPSGKEIKVPASKITLIKD